MKGQHKISKKRIVQVLAVLLVLSAVAAVARYLRSFLPGSGIMTSDEFYFTTDLTGDSTMVDSSGENPGNGYKYEDIQEETWNLYGGGAHEITFELCNYYDDLRITQEEIRYRVNVETKPPAVEGGDSSVSEDLAAIVKNPGDTPGTAIDGTLQGAGTGGKAAQKITLSIKSASEKRYKDGTEVTVTIQSTSPYKKVMKLHFLLYQIETYLCYEVRDSIGSPYAELIMMANSVSGGSRGNVQPYLTWTSDLSIDNTNSLTYQYSADNDNGFVQQAGIDDRNMQLSRNLKPKESESLYFFKSDVTKNYTKQRTIVNINEQKNYVIPVGKPS